MATKLFADLVGGNTVSTDHVRAFGSDGPPVNSSTCDSPVSPHQHLIDAETKQVNGHGSMWKCKRLLLWLVTIVAAACSAHGPPLPAAVFKSFSAALSLPHKQLLGHALVFINFLPPPSDTYPHTITAFDSSALVEYQSKTRHLSSVRSENCTHFTHLHLALNLHTMASGTPTEDRDPVQDRVRADDRIEEFIEENDLEVMEIIGQGKC